MFEVIINWSWQATTHTGPRYLTHCCRSFDLGHSWRSSSLPSPMSNLQKNSNQNFYYSWAIKQVKIVSQENKGKKFLVPLLVNESKISLPVKKWLTRICLTPLFVIYMQVMPITMPWINLHVAYSEEKKKSSGFTKTIAYSNSISRKNPKTIHYWTLKENSSINRIITASIQCWKANFCALASFDSPLPTCQR